MILSRFCYATLLFIITTQLSNEVTAFFSSYSESSKDDTQECNADKGCSGDVDYMSYLNYPQIHFSGIFRGSPSTVNNEAFNFETGKSFLKLEPSWNPKGTGEWNIDASVTEVCYINSHCKRVKGAQITDVGMHSFAKLVDIDVAAQTFSEIWGWRIRVGNSFEADFEPVSFHGLWTKLLHAKPSNHAFGAAYTSVLNNFRWLQKETNHELKEVVYEMRRPFTSEENIEFSIHLNLDLYSSNDTWANFTWGRLTGVIGVHGSKAPPFFVGHGRMLLTRDEAVQNAPFIMDTRNKIVLVDFGNSLPITPSGDMSTLLDSLVLAVDKTGSPNFDCQDELLWLGVVDNKRVPDWYETSAGIQKFPSIGVFNEEQEKVIQEHPLVVLEVKGNWPEVTCSRVLLAEHQTGLHVHPFSRWTNRYEAGDVAEFQFVVTQFGREAQNKEIEFQECLKVFGVPKGWPPLGLPRLPKPGKIKTDGNGIATVKIKTINQKQRRGYIDGQLYGFCYSVTGGPPANDKSLVDNVVVIKVYDYYPDFPCPTWLGEIYPIFKQYAVLYPVMTENFVDLGDYYQVKSHKVVIKMTLNLPIHNANYMPATRDLSKAKLKVINRWLDSPDLPIGHWSTADYTIKQLKKDLQIALELEHATIPPYLTALATIKDICNSEVQFILKTVLVQEMLHMGLVANILNAIGGQPNLYYDGFIPDYPSQLPGGVQPDLVVPIEACSLSLIRNVFMKIEQPSYMPADNHSNDVQPEEASFNSEHKPAFDYRGQTLTQNRARNLLYAVSNQDVQPSFIDESNSIGSFYRHVIKQLRVLHHRHENLFSRGVESRQLQWKKFKNSYGLGKLIKVTDLKSALAAINEIVEQGEGSSVCNPFHAFDKKRQLSHYYLFECIVEKHQMRIHKDRKLQSDDVAATKLIKKECNINYTFAFDGPKIPFDKGSVWPMINSPKMSMYKPGSRAHFNAVLFNKAYTKLLRVLHDAFNGGGDERMDDALGLMKTVQLHLKNLVRTPIDDDGNPGIGPNAGPTFTFTP